MMDAEIKSELNSNNKQNIKSDGHKMNADDEQRMEGNGDKEMNTKPEMNPEVKQKTESDAHHEINADDKEKLKLNDQDNANTRPEINFDVKQIVKADEHHKMNADVELKIEVDGDQMLNADTKPEVNPDSNQKIKADEHHKKNADNEQKMEVDDQMINADTKPEINPDSNQKIKADEHHKKHAGDKKRTEVNGDQEINADTKHEINPDVKQKIKINSSDAVQIVLIGPTGSGKSFTGNTILNKTTFRSETSGKSVTLSCQKEIETVNGRPVTVLDTPGWNCTELNKRTVKDQIRNALRDLKKPYSFLLVLRLALIKPKDVYEFLSSDFLANTTILFTHSDDLECKTFDEFLNKGNKEFKDLLSKCNNRCYCWNNKAERSDEEVEKLLQDLKKSEVIWKNDF